jgi:glycosyltransferase involved in cell wall biosynthesis
MTRPLRLACVFHDPQPSGASLWLRDFLRDGMFAPHECHAILPGESVMEPILRTAGVPCHRVGLVAGDAMVGGLANRIARIGNRLAAITEYRHLYKAIGATAVYVNSSVQIAPMIAARLAGLPLFVHVREGWHTGRTHGLKRWCVRHLAGACGFDASAGIKLFGPPLAGRRWEVVPNGVDATLADRRHRAGELRAELGLPTDRRIVLFLGTMGRRKGVHDLVECWPAIRAAHPETLLVLAGGIDPAESHPRIREAIGATPEGIRYIGFSPRAHDLLAAADFFVLPSYGEAMPISISEAMMIGTPVVARRVGDVEFQIGEGRGFLFHGDGPASLQAALLEALSDSVAASLRAAAAQRFAIAHLDRRAQAAHLLELVGAAIKLQAK